MSVPVGLVLRVLLPDGWVERPHDPPGRAYQATYGQPAGWLRMSVHPPLGPCSRAELDERLADRLEEAVDAELGEPLGPGMGVGPCTLGRVVVATYRHPRVGFVRLWMLGGAKGTVFATYEMGNPHTVKREMADAHDIVESADLDELDLAGLHSALPRSY